MILDGEGPSREKQVVGSDTFAGQTTGVGIIATVGLQPECINIA